MINTTKYYELLGEEQTNTLLNFFDDINAGTYNKSKTLKVFVKTLKHPIIMRCIKADMQSFINTFIDPYLEKKLFFETINFVIDGGANIGYTAVLYANWWPNATIVSVEPDAENFELAVLNAKPYPNIKVVKGGVWNKTANLKIEAGQEDGFVVREVLITEQIVEQNLTKGISINDLMKIGKANSIDFLKLNIEGSEKEVFESNYENWLPKTKAMLIELHDGKNAGCAKTVFNTLNKFDFAVAETAAYGVLFCKEAIYRQWYAQWYANEIYTPNINKQRFPKLYLQNETI